MNEGNTVTIKNEGAAPEAHGGIFGLGEPNDAFAPYFIGQSYLNALTARAITCPSTTSPLSRAAATTGTFTTRARAADRY